MSSPIAPPDPAQRQFDLQGHRGARGLWPENTIEGVERTLALGVSSVEIDTVLTSDGVAVVFHDPRLNLDLVRDSGGHYVAKPGTPITQLTHAALSAYDVGRPRPGSRLAARFPGQTPIDGARIPRLIDVCARLRGTGVRLDIEIKSPGDSKAVAEAVAAHIPGDPSLELSFRSFDWAVLSHVHRLRPMAPLAWLTPARRLGPAPVVADIMKLGRLEWMPVWAPDHRTLRKHDICAAHAAGLRVVPYTVNAPPRMTTLIAWGADAFCTDRPDLARPILQQAGIALPMPVT